MKRLILWLLFGLTILSCSINGDQFQIKGVESNPTLVAPIAYGDLSISDLLKKSDSSHITVGSDGLVSLIYDQNLVSHDIRNLVDIPDIGNKNFILAVPKGTYPANVNDYTSTTSSQSVDMGISPEKLTEIAFKSGSLTYTMNLTPSNSNFNYAAQISISEFKSKATGASFVQEVTGSGTIPLSDYLFQSAVANTFTLKVTLVIKKNSSSSTVPINTNLNVTISFAGMDFNYVKGFLGDQVAPIPPKVDSASINIQAFGTSFQQGASVSFAQPTISLNVTTGYGVPLKVTFAKLEAQKSGSTLAMQTNPVSPITVAYPTVLGDSATTSVAITNVNQLINFAPTKLFYQVSGHINQGLSSGNNFLADTSKMNVKLHVAIPLYGKASNIYLKDTVDLDLSNLDQTKIDSASLKATITNQLPLDGNIQFILTDANYVFIDSLLTASQTNIIKGSTVDANGELQSPGITNTFIPLQLNTISDIFKAKKIIIKTRLNTSKSSAGVAVDVKFKSQYKIDFHLGLKTTLKLKATF
ncbi:MAG TPA: hypothetical protein DGG95_07730 [Cytophagales bacterium]|jgi:hypothetical protein|nr:hypothetical protein [Cytophagales bacterium]